MNTKDLSIIIPAYNAETYIRDCLGSLTKIVDESLEIIVVNDGSTDNTGLIIDNCCNNDPRITQIKLENGGVSRARNAGLEHASGKYIMFLDADDYLIPDSIVLIKEIMTADKYDFAAFSRQIIEANKTPWNDSFFFKEKETTDQSIIDSIMYTDSHFNECWGKLYKKEIIDRFGIQFPQGVVIGEDLMFVMEYYSHCSLVYASNVPAVAYRQHGTSAMRRYYTTDRLRFTQQLFLFTKKYVPEALYEKYWFYSFRILTNLCREYLSDASDSNVIKLIYRSQMASEVMHNLKASEVPLFRKHEYFLMKHKMYFLSAVYYHLKSTAGR